MTESVQRKMAKGAVWMVLFKLVERGLGLISTLILARLLGPADFGVVAMAMSFIFMAELLTAFGFDIAIIQNQGATEAHYNTAWTCNLLLGASVTLVMLIVAHPIALFYQRPDVFWVVIALAFGPLVAGAENIGVVAFRKQLDFRREFKLQVTRKLVGFCIVVPLAFATRSYWTLVVGILVSKTAGTVISYLMHPFRPRFAMSKFQQLFRFSRWLLFNNLVSFLKERSSDFFIGRMFGAAPLGAYNVAYELAHLPSTEISAPINRALLPGFAKMETVEEVTSSYKTAIGLLALLALPAAAAIFAVAHYIVPVILGTKWLSAVPLMQVLAINGAMQMFHASIATVLVSRGYAGRVSAANALYVAFLVGMLVFVAMHFDIVKAAYCVLAATIVSTPFYLYQVRRTIGVPYRAFGLAVLRPALAASAAAALVVYALPVYHVDMHPMLVLALLIGGLVLGALTYITLAMLLWRVAGSPAGAERTALDRITEVLGPRLPAWLMRRVASSPAGAERTALDGITEVLGPRLPAWLMRRVTGT